MVGVGLWPQALPSGPQAGVSLRGALTSQLLLQLQLVKNNFSGRQLPRGVAQPSGPAQPRLPPPAPGASWGCKQGAQGTLSRLPGSAQPGVLQGTVPALCLPGTGPDRVQVTHGLVADRQVTAAPQAAVARSAAGQISALQRGLQEARTSKKAAAPAPAGALPVDTCCPQSCWHMSTKGGRSGMAPR